MNLKTFKLSIAIFLVLVGFFITIVKSLIFNEAKTEIRYYTDDTLRSFDMERHPFTKDIETIPLAATQKFNLNNTIKNSILKQNNYYKLINYSHIASHDNFDLFTVFGYYDTYYNIILVSSNEKHDSLIAHKIIASKLGDGDISVRISTKFLDTANFETQQSNFTRVDIQDKQYHTKLDSSITEGYTISSQGNFVKNNK